MAPAFADLDADGDGQLCEEEFSSAGAVWLAEKDTDGDGVLSREELTAAMVERMNEIADRSSARMIERLDENDDGMIVADEIGRRHDPVELLSCLDEDGDGSISEDEFERMKAKDGRRHRSGKWGRRHRCRDRNWRMSGRHAGHADRSIRRLTVSAACRTRHGQGDMTGSLRMKTCLQPIGA